MASPDLTSPGGDLADLKSRAAALRQASALPGADWPTLLDAALAELDGAIDATAGSGGQPDATGSGKALSDLQSERRLLHAVFTGAPVPLYVVDHDGVVMRANQAASDLLGVGTGYATGKSMASLIVPSARAALRSQLAAAARTAKTVRLTCGMLGSAGVVPCKLIIGPVSVRGDSDRLLVTLSRDSSLETGSGAPAGEAAEEPAQGGASVPTAVRRLDLLTATAMLLLEGVGLSESVLLQRCARLLSGSLATWVVMDVNRRGQLRRHYVAGPADPESAALAHKIAASDPGPASAPDQVFESGQPLLLAHIDDDTALGAGPGGPLLAMLSAGSLLAVPIGGGSRPGGVLTLVQDASAGQLSIADAALASEIGALLGLAITARRTLRKSTEAADALRASLLPPVLKPVPGAEIASAHLIPTRGREVGGDFYDVYPTPGGWGLAIGDVCGKGEDAAAATAAARHAIRVLAHWNADPAQVLRDANEIMLAEEFGGRFVTASAAHLSWQDGTLRIVLATAGHPGPVLVRPDGRAQLVPGGGVPLGIFPDPEPATIELELTTGDVLFFYTDGLADARSPQAAYFEDSLADCLAQMAGRDPAEIVSDLRKVVLDFCGNVLLDDLTMLALRAGTAPAS
jgi:serine phosphatase RsbU (regulator of sigma subunit)/PAS domain-containing protein